MRLFKKSLVLITLLSFMFSVEKTPFTGNDVPKVQNSLNEKIAAEKAKIDNQEKIRDYIDQGLGRAENNITLDFIIVVVVF